MPARGLLGWEGGGSDAADAVGVADALDLDDLAAGDGENQNDEGAPFPCDDHSRGAVDQHRVQLSTSAAAGQLRHGLCAVDVNWRRPKPSSRATTSGSSTSTRASKSPARAAANGSMPCSSMYQRRTAARSSGERIDGAESSQHGGSPIGHLSVLVEVDEVAAGVFEHGVHAAVVHPGGLMDERDSLGLEPVGVSLTVVSA